MTTQDKKSTRNSIPHKHMGRSEDEDKDHLKRLTSQTSQDHTFLQNYTEQNKKKQKNSVRMQVETWILTGQNVIDTWPLIGSCPFQNT